ncbi:unnamed protein product [Prorocentrum cordatum]|uniref:Uncharacterized protein n=1 Tax=Prorocentrum cordatum TaxID=2364126 RepID=A0ABN9RT69_9DINO|nr:unnamed protein product [Polarella glacialis]
MPQRYLNALVVLGTAAIAAWRESLRYDGEGGCTLAVEALARELEYQLNLSGSTFPAPAPLTCPTEAVEAVKDKVEELAARGPQDNSGIASLAQLVGGVVGHAVPVGMPPDLDEYTEDYGLTTDEGPGEVVLLGLNGAAPGVLRRRLYRFKRGAYPDDGDLLRALGRGNRQCVGQCRLAGVEPVIVGEYVNHLGVIEVVPEEPPEAWRPSALEARGAGSRERSPPPVTEDHTAPKGQLWMIVEEASGKLRLGTEIEIHDGDFASGADAFVQRGGIWAHAQLVRAADVAAVCKEIRDHYHVPALAPGPEPSGPLAAGGTATPPPAAEDARTLWIDYDEQGKRHKSWHAFCGEITEEPLDCPELEGPPRGAMHLLKYMKRESGTPKRCFQDFARDYNIQKTDRVWHELSALVECVSLFGQYDQVNLPSLAGGERLCRRFNTIIEAYASGAGGTLNWELANILEGEIGATEAMDPQLRQYSMKKLKDQRDIASSRRPWGGGGKGDPQLPEATGKAKTKAKAKGDNNAQAAGRAADEG